MTRTLLLTTALLTAATVQPAESPLASLRTQSATFTLAENGSLSSVRRNADGRDYLATNQPAPVLSIRVGGTVHPPESASWDPRQGRLTLHFKSLDITAVVLVQAKASHVVFELVELQPMEAVELVLWGPYPTTIGDIIGEVVGVVRDARVRGGHPGAEREDAWRLPGSRRTTSKPITAPTIPAPMRTCRRSLGRTSSSEGTRRERTEFGSVLQAYCRNRGTDRIIANWGHEKYLAPAYNDGGVIGSKIALFACPAAKALETIGDIELAEGLPHPMLDGVWAKVANQRQLLLSHRGFQRGDD